MPAAALTPAPQEMRAALGEQSPTARPQIGASFGPRSGAWVRARPERLRLQPTGSGRALLLLSLVLLGLNWGLRGEVGAPAATGVALWFATGLAARRNLVELDLSIQGACVVRAGDRAALGVRWSGGGRGSVGRDWELLWLEPDDSGRRRERVVARSAWARVRPRQEPDGVVEGCAARLFARRGRWREQRLRLRSLFPLGLWVGEREWSAEVDYRATPRAGRLTAAWRWPSAGARRGNRRSAAGSDEFRGLRPLRPGESLHRVRWKLAARHSAWQVGEWCDPRAPELIVLFDPRPARLRSSGWDAAFERGLSCLVTVAARALRDGREVRVIWGDLSAWTLRPGWDLERLAWELCEAQPEDPRSEAQARSAWGPGSHVLRLHFGRPRGELPAGAVDLDVLSEEFERAFLAPGSLRAGGRS